MYKYCQFQITSNAVETCVEVWNCVWLLHRAMVMKQFTGRISTWHWQTKYTHIPCFHATYVHGIRSELKSTVISSWNQSQCPKLSEKWSFQLGGAFQLHAKQSVLTLFPHVDNPLVGFLISLRAYSSDTFLSMTWSFARGNYSPLDVAGWDCINWVHSLHRLHLEKNHNCFLFWLLNCIVLLHVCDLCSIWVSSRSFLTHGICIDAHNSIF